MRACHVLTLSIAVVFVAGCSDGKHVGKWTGKYNDEEVTLILKDNGEAVLIVGNDHLGGDGFTDASGEKVLVTYEVEHADDDKYTLVLTVANSDKEITQDLYFSFLDDDTMSMAMRSGAGETILKRVD